MDGKVTLRRNAAWGSHRTWLWGLGVAWLSLVVMLGMAFISGSWGIGAIVLAPFATGYTLGRWVQTTIVLKAFTVVIAIASVILGAVTANLAGAICGFVFGMIASGPLLLGVFVGAQVSGNVRPISSLASVAFVALLIPLEQAALPTAPVESVATTFVVAMDRHEAFERLHFYEDTRGTPPRLLQMALPRPIRTVGSGKVGTIQRCVYDQGYIDKEITESQPGERYAFRVLDHVGVEDHSVTLTSGSFDFEPAGRDRTRVTLTTSYRPKLSARFAWRPFEQAVIHALHRHVIDSMTLRAQGGDANPPSPIPSAP